MWWCFPGEAWVCGEGRSPDRHDSLQTERGGKSWVTLEAYRGGMPHTHLPRYLQVPTYRRPHIRYREAVQQVIYTAALHRHKRKAPLPQHSRYIAIPPGSKEAVDIH